MSMQSDDWRSRLESLRGALPADGDTDTAQEPAQEAAPAQGRLDIVFEKKGRAGKTATIICGFTIGDDEVERVASRLKRSLGCARRRDTHTGRPPLRRAAGACPHGL